jgi:nucleoid DNA-binding protein
MFKFAVGAIEMKTDLISSIRGLLFRHDCVIIPGFGGFICNYVPATIDKSTGMFHPPARRVSFNRNLSNNDGLLVGDISSREGINYGEAREIVEQFASDLKKRVTRGEVVTFDLIGTFRTNSEGSIQFEPDNNANYNAGSYGMESFRFDPVAGYDVRKKVMRVHGEIAPSRIPLRKHLIRAAVAIPVLIALVAVPLKTDIFGTRFNKASINPLASAEFEHNREALNSDSANNTVQPQEAITGTETSTVVAEPEPKAEIPVPVTPEPEVKVNYLLIAGSFQSEQNARVMEKKLIGLGYTPELIAGPDGYTRVSAKGFPDIASANSERQKLSAAVDGVWVLRKK